MWFSLWRESRESHDLQQETSNSVGCFFLFGSYDPFGLGSWGLDLVS